MSLHHNAATLWYRMCNEDDYFVTMRLDGASRPDGQRGPSRPRGTRIRGRPGERTTHDRPPPRNPRLGHGQNGGRRRPRANTRRSRVQMNAATFRAPGARHLDGRVAPVPEKADESEREQHRRHITHPTAHLNAAQLKNMMRSVNIDQCSDLGIQTTHGLLGVREMCSRVAMKKYTWTHMNRSSAC